MSTSRPWPNPIRNRSIGRYAGRQCLVAGPRRGPSRAVTAEAEERRFTGGSVVMRKGEVVDAWTGVIDGLVKINSFPPAAKPPPSPASAREAGSARARC